MRHAALLLASAAVLACSSGRKQDAQIIKPEIQLVELSGPQDVGYANGPTQIQFGLRVANRSAEPITLKRIDIQSISEGAYIVRRQFFTYDRKIGPDQYDDVAFWARAYAFATTRGGEPSNEPVNLRAIIYFDSPAGSFHQVVMKMLTQFGGRRGE